MLAKGFEVWRLEQWSIPTTAPLCHWGADRSHQSSSPGSFSIQRPKKLWPGHRLVHTMKSSCPRGLSRRMWQVSVSGWHATWNCAGWKKPSSYVGHLGMTSLIAQTARIQLGHFPLLRVARPYHCIRIHCSYKGRSSRRDLPGCTSEFL